MGAGLVGTGWVAGRQLAGKVVPAETTSSLGLEWRGRRGEGQSPARLYLATLLIPKQQDLPFLSLQLLDPDKHKPPSMASPFKVLGPQSPGEDRGGTEASKTLTLTHSF